MRKHSVKAIILIVLISGFYIACVNPTPAIKEDPIEKTYDLTGFTKIGLGIHADVYYEQSSEYEVKVVAKESAINKITVEVNGDELKIHHKGHSLSNTGDIDIYISCPKIEGFSISGSGKVIVDKPVNTKNLDIKISGSGNVILHELNAELVKLNISGSGNLKFEAEGKVNKTELHISGSGNVHAENVEMGELNGKISGSGNGRFFITDRITAKISGSGDIYYKGNPVIDVEISGSGKIKPL
ncbi:MAG: DUF2807 domain-containing protein [Bacteroidales bacterium]|nr:DUF2807 domain-containing protein [Bacteroidales bacterium]